jgi:hypothetical protein
MKLTLVTVVIAGLASLVYHQSGCLKDAYISPNPLMVNSTSAETRRSDGRKGSEDLQSRYKAMQDALRRESARLRIGNLQDTPTAAAETETRIWVGFGLVLPRCIILRNERGKTKAFYFGTRIVRNRAVKDANGGVLSAKRVLRSPRSGWQEFDKFLKEQGIDSPLGLSVDDRFGPGPDGEIIVVEAKTLTDYSMVFFPVHAESQDGQKALQVCRRIEREFNVTMGCGNVGTPPK